MPGPKNHFFAEFHKDEGRMEGIKLPSEGMKLADEGVLFSVLVGGGPEFVFVGDGFNVS